MLRNRHLDYERFISLNEASRHKIPVCLSQAQDSLDFQYRPSWGYFYQDLWGAQKIYDNAPVRHMDVGSSVGGFISHLLSFRKNIVLIDVRPSSAEIEGVQYICADATDLKEIKSDSVESLSALCSVEHFGLGRYGDPIAPDGWYRALRSFYRVLAKNGKLYFSVPVGKENALCFNAHRIFSFDKIINAVPELELTEFSCVFSNTIEPLMWKEEGLLHKSDSFNELDKLTGGKHCIGLFEFTKI